LILEKTGESMLKKITASLFAIAIAASVSACAGPATPAPEPTETIVLQSKADACAVFETFIDEASGTLDEILDLGTKEAIDSREYLSANLIRISDDATAAINPEDSELDAAINDFFSAMTDFANVLSVPPAQQDADARDLAVGKASTTGDRITRLCE
ncbi:MAG: hypothetical protein RLZ06_519, partial [Actinomycetota bacterium]